MRCLELSTWLLSCSLCSLSLLGGAGCSSDKVASSGAAAGASSAAGAGSAGAPASEVPLELPFLVNAPGNYAKSGFMGDAALSVVAAPSATDSDGTCAGQRASATAGGDCDTFKIAPAAQGLGWQGVFYQFPAGNWGSFPGRQIAAGATKVTFWARASRPVGVKFQTGMCDAAHASDPTQCADGFFAFASGADAADNASVGAQWAQFSIDLTGVDYAAGVRGAFSWVIVNADLKSDSSALSLYLDDIRWQ